MARPSPGAQRVVALLNFFADNPGRAFSMTDLIRALKFNRSTLHSLLAELVEANYLFRTKDKLYVLGSGAARLGMVAAEHLSPLQVANPEMRSLADEFEVVCSAMFRDRNEVVIRERAAAITKLDWYPSRTYRWPMALPGGTLFFIGSPQAEIEAWLDSLSPPPSDEDRERTLEGLAFAREHGFHFVVREGFGEANESSAEWRFLGDSPSRRLIVGTSLEADRLYSIASIASPVRDAQGRVAFNLSLSAFDHQYRGADIARMGERLTQACRNISQIFKGMPD
jgi:DNA-binding IclR family transcriptional regulator